MTNNIGKMSPGKSMRIVQRHGVTMQIFVYAQYILYKTERVPME